MDYLAELKGLALASRMKRTVERLNTEMKAIYKEREIDLEPLLMPVMKILHTHGSHNVGEIAEFLGISQPAVTQLCAVLSARKLIRMRSSASDKRKKEIQLSEQGNKLLEKLLPVWQEVESSVNSMLDSSEHHLLKAIESFETQLRAQSLKDRVMERLNQSTEVLEIIDYKEKYKNSFRDLNYEWIQKYFVVEKTDEQVLSNPKEAILDNGGAIYFARYGNKIVGTFALIRVDEETCEIAKMAVTEKFQKHGIGKKLLDHALLKAKSMKLKKLILYSNTNLAPAINLYFKYGFRVIPKTDFHNNRANIKMEKTI
jgi:DNA-binding MarR family transcriptional regulator/predicted GNAT family acetyltransferase